MNAALLLKELYEYKAWSESKIFEHLLSPIAETYPDEMEKALYYLAHINIVDNIFISRLKGEAPSQTSIVTDEKQNVRELRERFTTTNKWLLDYVNKVTNEDLQFNIPFTFIDGDKGIMTKAQMLTHLITHGLLHKGGIGSLLPKDVLIGWKSNYTSFLHK